MRPLTARKLVLGFTQRGEKVFDPFVGSGTVALEAYVHGRQVVCADLNPYAYVLTKAKLNPPQNVERAVSRVEEDYGDLPPTTPEQISAIPRWVRSFFHVRTLMETWAIVRECQMKKDYFTLACLLGILHHQRPGFLSFPSNHLVPYRLNRKYPRSSYGSMYQYRPVTPRLIRKIYRAYHFFPKLDPSLVRECHQGDGLSVWLEKGSVNAIITSPPYMDNLDYVRDNRLRLWFLDQNTRLSGTRENGSANSFGLFMTRLFVYAHRVLAKRGHIALVLGHIRRDNRNFHIARMAKKIAITELGLFSLSEELRYPISKQRRSRPLGRGTISETILVLQK
jgi:hypothetical protein